MQASKGTLGPGLLLCAVLALGHGREVDEFGAAVRRGSARLGLAEVVRVDLQVAAGDGEDDVAGLADALSHLGSFSDIDFMVVTPTGQSVGSTNIHPRIDICMGMTPGLERYELRSGLGSETLVRRGLMEELGEAGRTADHAGTERDQAGWPRRHRLRALGHAPALYEIGELSKTTRLLVVTGGGARVRHIMDVGIDLGMPTGVLAELSAKISEQNAIMVSLLLSPWGGTRIDSTDLLDLPTLLRLGDAPRDSWNAAIRALRAPGPCRRDPAPPDGHGRVPDRGGDRGAYLHPRQERGRALLCRSADAIRRRSDFPEIRADEVIAMNLDDLVLERMVLEADAAGRSHPRDPDCELPCTRQHHRSRSGRPDRGRPVIRA